MAPPPHRHVVTVASLEGARSGHADTGVGARQIGVASACGRPEFGETEIEQLRTARREHDVGGLQIPVDDSVPMRVVEGTGDLVRICKRLVQRHWPVRQSRGQRFAFEVLHDDEVDLIVTADVVESADVRVRERSHRSCFSGEPGAHLLIERGTDGKNFDGHPTMEAGVGRVENLSHASGAEGTFNAVRAERRTRPKVGTIVEQGCGRGPHRAIDDDLCGLLAQQRIHFASQRLVARARLGEKRVARGGVAVDGQLVDSGDLPPALGSQVHPSLVVLERKAAGVYSDAGNTARSRFDEISSTVGLSTDSCRGPPPHG